MALTEATALTPRSQQTSRSRPFCVLTVGLLAVVASEARAEFNAGARLGVSRTDNVFLSAPGEEIDDRFYQISPFIRWSTESRTLDGLFDYRYDRYRYDDLELDQSWHYLNLDLNGKAFDETLFLRGGATRRQVLRDPNSDVLPGPAPISGNLTNLDQWYVSPGFNRTFGGATTLALNYRYTDSRYDDAVQRRDQTQDAQFRLNNYVAGQGLSWALRYNYVRTDYEFSVPFEYQIGGAELGYWANGNVRLFAGGGRESRWDDPVDRSPQDPYWEAGFAYQAGEKITAEIAAGERSFGDSVRANLAYVFRRGSTNLSYRELPTTEGFNRRRGGNPDPINPQDPDDFLTDPGRAERFISERFDWDVSLEGRRTQLRFSVFYENRTGRFAADGTALEDQDQRAANIRFSWEAGTRTEFIIDGAFVNRSLGEELSDDFIRGRASINYRLGSKTTLSLAHQYADQDPNENSATREYTANITSLFITFALQQDQN